MLRGKRLGAIALAGLSVMLLVGCNKVTGGGGFITQGVGGGVPGDQCTLGFTAQPTDAAGDAKGQLQFVDHDMQGLTDQVSIHSALNITLGTDPLNPNLAGYVGLGTATVSIDGTDIGDNFSVATFAADGGKGNPDQVLIALYDSNGNFLYEWDGLVTNGNIVVH
jgi:hypothetical protein